jgi:ornithine cyclodeaminase/alanine dehydrogenase
MLILNDYESGLPLAVMDCTWIIAQRTGAATALAARYLARLDSETLGILGCGVQGRSNLEALQLLFPLKKVFAFDTHGERAANYARDLRSRFGIEVEPVRDPKEAVGSSDMVVTAGPILRKPHAPIREEWLPEGAFASLVDFDSY